jgi:hypothetical protein
MESPVKGSFESLITSYDDINTQQQKITEERFPDIILELSGNCLWSWMCFNYKGLIMKCPMCDMEISQIPMSIDEVLHTEFTRH